MTDPNRVESVERALSLLQCFRAPGEELSLAVLAQRSTLYKSTILRLLGSLAHMGFVHRRPDGLFKLGPELRRLGALASETIDLGDVIRPALAEIVAETQETASFYVREGEARLCLYLHNSPRSARHHLDEGARHPLDRGAAADVLRAFGSTMAPRDAAVRRQGWAVSLGGRDPDLAAVAVPLFDGSGTLLGALTVSGLRSRFSDEVVDHARGVLLGWTATLRHRVPTGPSTGRKESDGRVVDR